MSLFTKIFVRNNFLRFSSKSIRLVSTASDANIVTSDSPDVVIPRSTIPEFIFERCKDYSKFVATECSVTGRKYTYEEVFQKARNLGKSLRKKLNLQKGDVVAILLPNIPEFPISTLGILDAGLVITTLNPLYTPDEISKQLNDSNAKTIITLSILSEKSIEAVELCKRKIPILAIKFQGTEGQPDGTINFDEFVNTTVDIPNFESGSPDDLAFLPYSSGTTGLPKGVQLSHYNILANLFQVNSPEFNLFEKPSGEHQDQVPVVLPLFHIYGFTGSLHMFVNGSKAITIPMFTPENYISVLQNNRINRIIAAPPLVLFLASNPEVKPKYLESIRSLFSGAAPLGALDEERFLAKAKHVLILQGYGMTETSPAVTMTTQDIKRKLNPYGTIGTVLPNTQLKLVAIDDPTGTPLGPNQKGELLVKGPQVMKGYHNRPKETEESFTDGWLRTGDLMHYDENKLFYVSERLKELIKVKGFQVAPAELEEIIRDFPNVDDAAVIGIPHESHGEVPRAYIVLKDPTKFKHEELNNFVAKKVVNYKQLQGGIEIVDAIPKNAAGKILRRQLKLEYQSKQNS